MCAMSGLCLENVSHISSLSSSHWQAHGLVVEARTTSRIETHFKFDKDTKLKKSRHLSGARSCNMADCIGLYFDQIHHSDGGYYDFFLDITKLTITNACTVIISTHTLFPLQNFSLVVIVTPKYLH